MNKERWKSILLFAVAVGMVWMFFTGRLFMRRVSALDNLRSTGKGWSFPSAVYSAPLTLEPGRPITQAMVLDHLRDAAYLPILRGAPQVGQYLSEGNRLVVAPRPLEYPDKAGVPTIEITFSESGVQSLKDADSGSPLDLATLEPIRLGSFTENAEERRWVKLEELPPYLPAAFVSVEDIRFYSHRGVDLKGLVRAAAQNFKAGHTVQGGSTITQQLVKNLFLTRDRTIRRKLLEIAIAVGMECVYSKDKILELYVNQIYLGQRGSTGVYGVEEGARLYFGKSAAQISIPEAALLAGLVKAPNLYSPHIHWELSLQRRNLVLGCMLAQNVITPEQYQEAVKTNLVVSAPPRVYPRQAPYFLAYVHDLLIEQFSPAMINSQGLNVFTTLDYRLQKIANETVKREAPRLGSEVAFVALDPHSGGILAMVGGTDFGKTQFNRAVQARRQPGSAFKPFVLAAALKAGQTLVSTQEDKPLTLQTPQGPWTPHNYTMTYSSQSVTLRDSVVASLNVPMVRAAMAVGVDKVAACAQDLGITSPLNPVPSLALGSSDVSLLEMAHAYSAFDGGGKRPDLHAVVSVTNHKQELLYRHELSWSQALDAKVAALVTDVLREVVEKGTGHWVKDWGFTKTAAGKTGTSDNFRDAWFIGYTPDLLAGVWAGFDHSKNLGMSAAQAALPLWASFMRDALQGLPDTPFPEMPGLISMSVDLDSGGRAKAGCLRVRKDLFIPGTEPKEDCPLHAGGVKGWFQKLFKRSG